MDSQLAAGRANIFRYLKNNVFNGIGWCDKSGSIFQLLEPLANSIVHHYLHYLGSALIHYRFISLRVSPVEQALDSLFTLRNFS